MKINFNHIQRLYNISIYGPGLNASLLVTQLGWVKKRSCSWRTDSKMEIALQWVYWEMQNKNGICENEREAELSRRRNWTEMQLQQRSQLIPAGSSGA